MWSHTLDTQLDKLVREKVYDFGAVAEEIQVIYNDGNDNNNDEQKFTTKNNQKITHDEDFDQEECRMRFCMLEEKSDK